MIQQGRDVRPTVKSGKLGGRCCKSGYGGENLNRGREWARDYLSDFKHEGHLAPRPQCLIPLSNKRNEESSEKGTGASSSDQK